jgi:hypothetical protein
MSLRVTLMSDSDWIPMGSTDEGSAVDNYGAYDPKTGRYLSWRVRLLLRIHCPACLRFRFSPGHWLSCR